MKVYVVYENDEDDNVIRLLGVVSSKEDLDRDYASHPFEVYDFVLDDYTQIKDRHGCNIEKKKQDNELAGFESEIDRLSDRLLIHYNEGRVFQARIYARNLVALLDHGKFLGYDMGDIEKALDQKLKQNYQEAPLRQAALEAAIEKREKARMELQELLDQFAQLTSA